MLSVRKPVVNKTSRQLLFGLTTLEHDTHPADPIMLSENKSLFISHVRLSDFYGNGLWSLISYLVTVVLECAKLLSTFKLKGDDI